MAAWTVAIDAVAPMAIDPASLVALDDALAEAGGIAADGSSLRATLSVPGADEGAALHAAMWVWRTALSTAGLPELPVVGVDVRAGVATPIARPAGRSAAAGAAKRKTSRSA